MKISNNISEIYFSYYGASIQKWIIKETKIGQIDIVLGLDNPEHYKENHPFFGSIVGRVANRIKNAQFTLNDKVYQLDANEGKNQLHSSYSNFAFKKWNKIIHTDSSISFQLKSDDSEGEFPGEVSITVTYNLKEDNSLDILYKGTTSKDTILNLTNHSYFNLNGHNGENILNHKVEINANHFTPISDDLIPTGVIQFIKNTPFDFTELKALRTLAFDHSAIKPTNGLDHNYVLKSKNNYAIAATIISDISDLKLECFTDQPGLQFYMGNGLDFTSGKNDTDYKQYQGFCLEAQFYPDSPNNLHFPSIVLKKGETYTQKTTYKISNK